MSHISDLSFHLKKSEKEEQIKLKVSERKEIIKIKLENRDLPCGTAVENPPANAGDTGSSPGPGRSHMLLSNEARAPQLLSLRSRARAPQQEATAMRSPCTTTKSSPHSPQLEKASHSNEDLMQPKIKKLIN